MFLTRAHNCKLYLCNRARSSTIILAEHPLRLHHHPQQIRPQPIYNDHLMKFAALALTVATTSAAFAQTLYVDTNGTASGFGSETTANWDASIWKPDTSGTSTTTTWIPGSVATFGTGAGRNLTISLSNTDVSLSGLTFNHATTVNSTGGTLTGTGNVTISGNANATIAAGINLGTNQLTKSGTGTLTLSGNSTLGSIRTSSGTLAAGSTGAFGTGTVTVEGGNLNLNGHNLAAQVITGNLTNTTVTNAQNYTGTVFFKDYVTGQLDGYAGPNPTTSGVFSAANIVLSDAVSLRYQTTGSVTLENANAELSLATFNGSTNHVGAVTVYAGKVNTEGPAGPNSIFDTLQVNGDLTLNNGTFTAFDGTTKSGFSELRFQIGEGGNSKLIVTGTAFFDGTLLVAGEGNFTAGLSFDLIDAASVVGTFDNMTLPTLAEGLEWDTAQLYSTGQISVSAVPEPAAFAALAGLATLALAATRRRSRSA